MNPALSDVRPGYGDVLVSIIAPFHNEAAILPAFVEEMSEVLRRHFDHHEIILVDDGSTDGTAERAEEALTRLDHLRLVRLSRRFGLDAAVSAGLELAIGDWVVVMDPNTDPPNLIPQLVDRARERADMIYGVRDKPAPEPLHIRIATNLFYWYAHRVMHLPLQRNATHLRVIGRQAVNAILKIQKRELYMRVLSLYIGFKSEPFAYKPIDRGGSTRRRSFGEMASLAIAITTENSSHPLRLLSLVALTASVLNVIYAVYVILIYFFKSRVAEGWVTLSLQSALQFFLISLVLAVLCEYTGRIFSRIAGRPSFYIMDEKSSAVELRNDRRNVVVSASEDSRR
ncbi:MAG TPA: glycosyltransferase family 2 protein [Gemmatimonadaceae bacterium]|nr:glycosyltransferase family 2 protein [Gemmatimonadaceae bacterium]